MTKDEELAMDLALEALENNRRTHYYCEDIWYSCPKHEDGCANEAEGDECNCGADKANQEIDKAITAIKQARSAPVQDCNLAEDGVCEALECCKQPAPVQEPVAWMFEDDEGDKHKTFRQTPPSPEDVAYIAKWNRPSWVPLYTTPPAAQRPWVGLTDEEIDKTRFAIQTKAITQRDHELSRAIEAKLKQKNI